MKYDDKIYIIFSYHVFLLLNKKEQGINTKLMSKDACQLERVPLMWV